MTISIIIPNWNGEEKLKKNLPKVLETEGVDEFIIVDDASTDGSIKLIENSFPKIKLIKKDKNSGFSSTVNLGVKSAQSDLVFLVNSDAVPDKKCLEKIRSYFKDFKIFSVGFNTGGSWAWAKFEKGYFWHYQAPKENPQKTHQTLWVSGGSGVFRKDIWQKLGGFDELMDPFYEEDVDLGYRATKRGYVNIWEADAFVEHYEEPGVISKNFSKDFVSKIAQRNQLIFIWKNIIDKDMINAHIGILLSKLLTSPKYFSVFLSALIRLMEIIKKRATEKKESVVTDREILEKY